MEKHMRFVQPISLLMSSREGLKRARQDIFDDEEPSKKVKTQETTDTQDALLSSLTPTNVSQSPHLPEPEGDDLTRSEWQSQNGARTHMGPTATLLNMQKLWNCLRNNLDDIQVNKPKNGESMVEVITLPEGIYWLTEPSRHLFVRECDKIMYDLVMSRSQSTSGALILGNPGIGTPHMT